MNRRKLALLFVCLFAASSPALAEGPRARDIGIPLAGKPGALNAITDVAGIEIGQVTLIGGEGALQRGKGPVRTGVTAIIPRGKDSTAPVYAGWETSNAAGEMTGTIWLEERGYLDGPIMITNTHSVGVVRDAVVGWIVDKKWPGSWFTPMVAETYDGFLNDTDGFHVKREHALDALQIAKSGPVAEGSVGGGTGMVCFGFKGGIGTSSRIVTTTVGQYTVGVLVQCNFGLQADLRIAGAQVGQELKGRYAACRSQPSGIEKLPECKPGAEKPGDGSMIAVIATDAPLLPHQLKRLAKRPAHAMGRLGDIGRESSGDIFVAFSTANPQLHSQQMDNISVAAYPNPLLNSIFEGAVQATEEAILNAMVAAKTMTGRDGHRVYGLPHDEVRAILKREGKAGR
ncbi:MAG TPA: P1 family peptidase [Steroidobacter sp.]|uniref:DmpA family aminopeptidase n=1 Tax=Steroidobacter sp. TaxID=1978227 RepID=UPI002ED7EEAB